MALLDIRVIDTDAKSHASRPITSILESAESDKKKKYGQACEERRATFTPFITSIDGVLGREARAFTKRLSLTLAEKWQRSYGSTLSWVRARILFATLRATNHCLRGSRTKWRSLGQEDGAAIRHALD